jgi:tetratricopeptide (TPR) repeat protein
MIGRVMARLEEWGLARQAFEQAIHSNSNYAEAWAFLAEARYQTGENGEEALATALRLNPRSALVQAITAVYWRRQGRLDEARSYLEEVARQEPAEFTWQIELGNLLAEMGDLQNARAHFQQAATLAPGNLFPWLALAQYSVDYQDDVRALGYSAAHQALQLAPDDPRALDVMGQVFLALNDTPSAERFLQRAIEQDAAYADAYLHLGQLFLQQQDQLQAQSYLQKALEIGQDQPAGKIASRLLQQYFNTGGQP